MYATISVQTWRTRKTNGRDLRLNWILPSSGLLRCVRWSETRRFGTTYRSHLPRSSCSRRKSRSCFCRSKNPQLRALPITSLKLRERIPNRTQSLLHIMYAYLLRKYSCIAIYINIIILTSFYVLKNISPNYVFRTVILDLEDIISVFWSCWFLQFFSCKVCMYVCVYIYIYDK